MTWKDAVTRLAAIALAVLMLAGVAGAGSAPLDVVDRVMRLAAWDLAVDADLRRADTEARRREVEALAALNLVEGLALRSSGALGAAAHAVTAAQVDRLAGTGTPEALAAARRALERQLKVALYDAKPAEGEVVQRMRVDLDGNQRADLVEVVVAANGMGRLRVTSDRAQLIWEGPDTKPLPDSLPDPLVLPVRKPGQGSAALVGDLGRDGILDLVCSPEPGTFRVLGWKAEEFVPQQAGRLVEQPYGTGRFAWSSRSDAITWIAGFRSIEDDGSAVADVEQKGGVRGVAIVEATSSGFRILRWVKGPW